MLSLKESLKILKETNALIEGHFVLSSGLHSSKYVQCAQLMSKPNQAIKICESLANKIKTEIKNFDLILSPAMGGIIVGYELGKILNKQTIFSERVDGVFKLRRNFQIKKLLDHLFFLKSTPYSDRGPFLNPNGPEIKIVIGFVPGFKSTL